MNCVKTGGTVPCFYTNQPKGSSTFAGNKICARLISGLSSQRTNLKGERKCLHVLTVFLVLATLTSSVSCSGFYTKKLVLAQLPACVEVIRLLWA